MDGKASLSILHRLMVRGNIMALLKTGMKKLLHLGQKYFCRSQVWKLRIWDCLKCGNHETQNLHAEMQRTIYRTGTTKLRTEL